MESTLNFKLQKQSLNQKTNVAKKMRGGVWFNLV